MFRTRGGARAPSVGSLLGETAASLRAFRHQDYVRIWTGSFVSNIGTWIQTIAVGVYVTETTGRAGWTGTIAALAYLPAVVFGPLGGALADRFDRRRFIAAATALQACAAIALALLAATDRLPVGAVAGLVLLSGCASAMAAPAFNALLIELVAPEEVLSAVSLASAQFNLARTVGPMLAALVLSAGGIATAFVVNAVTYLGVLVALASLRRKFAPLPRPDEGIWRGIVTGVGVARADPGIRLALPLVLVLSVLVAPFIGLMPAYAIKGFGRGAAGTAMLAAGQGIGALCAAFVANAIAERFGVRVLMSRALLAVGPIAMAYWLAPVYGAALGCVALLGGVYLLCLTSLSTTCMARVSRNLQARMNSLYSVTLSGGYSLGLMAQGWLADRIGLREVPAAAAAIALVLVVALARRGSFGAVDAPRRHAG